MSNKQKEQVRVRIAPSPTGMMHVGTARTALFNWLFAKKNNGVFVLRIEDTDKERSKKEYETSILDGLKWLDLDYDEFYRQSERTEIYKKHIKELLGNKSAFYCDHTKEELEAERENQETKKEAPRHVCDRGSSLKLQTSSIIRFKNPGGKIKFNDLIRGEIEFDLGLLGDFSLAKDENTPLYNLAASIDDYDMKISHVIRGEDHISNTPKQLAIYQALGWESPQFAHLPMILGTDKSKLSKRHGATAVVEYKEQGYLPEAMFNFLALLGWSPQSEDKEILTKGEIINSFALESIQKSGAVFNIDKLDWMNGEYIRSMALDELVVLCIPYLTQSVTEIDPDQAKKIVALEQPRLKKLSEIGESTQFFFEDKLLYDKELMRWKNMTDDELKEILKKLYDMLSGISKEDFTKEKLEEIIMPYAEEIGRVGDKIDRGKILWPMRVALTGQKASPGPFEVAEILGKEKCLRRLQEAMDLLHG